MNPFSLAKSLSVSVRVYRAMLVAYPRKFREGYETQMVQVFRDSFRDAYHRHGTSGVIDLWLHTCADLLVTALIERMTEGSQYMFSPRLIFWGGLASAFGGIMWCLPLLAAAGEIPLSLALLLTLAGLAALHARQGNQAGALSWAGFILGILGTGLVLSLFVWSIISGNSLNPERDSSSALQFAQLALGMSILGIGYILIGLRLLQTRVLSRSTTMLPVALGVLHVGLGFSIWLLYSLISNGIDPWNPMAVPASAALLLSFVIGILWLVLGAILAGDSGWQTSNRPPASA